MFVFYLGFLMFSRCIEGNIGLIWVNKQTQEGCRRAEYHPSSLIKQKDKSQNGGYEKTKHAKFPEKLTFLTPWYVHVTKLLLTFFKRPLCQARYIHKIVTEWISYLFSTCWHRAPFTLLCFLTLFNFFFSFSGMLTALRRLVFVEV